ncbi:hypothetical protein ACQ4PT_020094 [Festuca glaucescens]
MELSGSSQFSESPEISLGEEEVVEQETDGLEEDLARLEEEASGSDQDVGPNLAAYTRGAWKGSDVSQAEIDWLYRSRRIPEEVSCRIPGNEREPVPNPDEVVVFTAHFERGFGLPASDFFWRFLDFYELQPHHLPANAIFYLSSFVSFMEGFVGLLPTVETFARFYNLRINSIQDPKLPTLKPIVQCGACILTPRQGSPYYKFTGLESCRAWQETFFYVRNSGPSDFINLPAYLPSAPARTNWRFNPKDRHVETNRIIRYMEKLNDTTNICADDIVRAFISRRVLPLQRRAHKICQMTGRKDPTRITTFPLRKSDVVLKTKQICKTKMPVDWKWGMQPFSRRHPPTSQDFPRIAAEEPGSFAPKRLYEDDEDPDPYTVGNVHKMGPTHSRRPGNTPAPRSSRARANACDSDDDDCTMLEVFGPLPLSYALSAMSVSADQDRQVLEHATPLAAEVGDPPASRVRKALAPEAGSSGAPASKCQKVASSGPPRKKKRNAIPTSSGAPLELTRSAPGMRREAAKDTGETPETPRQSPARSGAGKAHSSPRGGTTSSGCAAPKKKHHRAEGDSSSPPEVEDTGASNTGAGSEQTGQPEPSVPPVLEKTSKVVTASPSKTSSAPTQPPSPAKGAAAPPPAFSSKPPPALSGQKLFRKNANINAEQLSGVVEAAVAQPTGSRELTLHAGRAAITAGEKVSAQLGRIVELNRGEANLGALQRYVDKWNTSDMTEATIDVGKDKQVVIDNRGPWNTVQHLARLKHAVREFDNAWHDANHNVLGVLDSCKKLFEELLWEHRDLTEAFAALKLSHSQCQAALPEASLDDLTGQIAALKAEKEELSVQHQRDLQAQRNETAKLKEQLVEAGLQHAGALKEAIAAGEAKVEEARKQFADAEEQLRQELEEEKKLRQQEQERNDELLAVQVSLDQMVKDVDDKALSRILLGFPGTCRGYCCQGPG